MRSWSLCLLSCFSCVQLFVTLWNLAHQGPLYMGILQARILEWVVMTSSREPPNPEIQSTSFACPALTGGFFTTSTTWKFSSFQSLSHVWLFETPWTTAHQTSLSITNPQSLLKLMSIELVMPSNHLILCHPLLLLPSILPSIRLFSNHPLWKGTCYYCVRLTMWLELKFVN